MENALSTEEYFDLSFSEEPASYYYLLLTIDREWVHAAWFHSTKNLVTGFARYPHHNSLKDLVKKHPYLQSEFKEVIIGIQEQNYLLYPKFVLDGTNPGIFQLTNPLDTEEESLMSGELVSLQASIAFAAPTRLITDIYDTFKHVKVISHVHPRIEQEFNAMKASGSNKPMFSVHVWNDQLDIRAYKEGEIYLANTYYQSGKEDIAYYVLYASELLKIQPDEALLSLSGSIEIGDDTWELLANYWKRMEIAQGLDKVIISEKLSDFSHSKFDHLTHALLCVS
ncbi:MAG: DUF3822 family protein [Cryomorphaceae bacterium]